MTTGQTVRLPSVDRILGDAACLALIARYGRVQTLDCARAVLAELRTAMLAGAACEEGASIAAIAAQMDERLQAQARSQLRAVFNLTGTVLHTNLGRALLPDAAVQAVVEALQWPMNLEFDLETGKRGDRDDTVRVPMQQKPIGSDVAPGLYVDPDGVEWYKPAHR